MSNMTTQNKLYIVDIDGTLLYFVPTIDEVLTNKHIPALPGAAEKTREWYQQGHTIILTTARSESMRKITVQQLHNAKIIYHQLLMDIPNGPRILINDITEEAAGKGEYKAFAFNVVRNKDGIANIP